VVTNYTYDDDNRLLSAGSVTYAWDANGNMVSRTVDGVTITFGYDEEDRLQRIVRSVAGQMIFTHLYNYDGLGRRFFRWVSDSGASRSVVYRFAGDALLREQWNNPNPNNHLMMDWKYTWAGGMVNAVNILWGDQWWSGGDRLGSARVHTDETGGWVTYIGYFTAFGERLDAGFRTAYTLAGDWGYRDDGDAGLLYIGARYYEPAVGRWTSADKWLGDIYRPLSLNRYLYCEDDPVNSVDPTGRRPNRLWPWLRGISIAVTIGILAILAAREFAEWMGSKEREEGHSWGGVYGRSHEHQIRMMERLSDPDYKGP